MRWLGKDKLTACHYWNSDHRGGLMLLWCGVPPSAHTPLAPWGFQWQELRLKPLFVLWFVSIVFMVHLRLWGFGTCRRTRTTTKRKNNTTKRLTEQTSTRQHRLTMQKNTHTQQYSRVCMLTFSEGHDVWQEVVGVTNEARCCPYLLVDLPVRHKLLEQKIWE